MIDQKGVYQRVEQLAWSQEQEQTGQMVWLRAFGWIRLFRMERRLTGGTTQTQFYMTNRLSGTTRAMAETVLGYRWKIEQYHRELKQLTGIERCQARKQRAQRNHIHCAIIAWLHLWERAKRIGATVYQVKRRLLYDYLCHEIRTPAVPVALHPT